MPPRRENVVMSSAKMICRLSSSYTKTSPAGKLANIVGDESHHGLGLVDVVVDVEDVDAVDVVVCELVVLGVVVDVVEGEEELLKELVDSVLVVESVLLLEVVDRDVDVEVVA